MALEKQWRMIQLMAERTNENMLEWVPGLTENSVQIVNKKYSVTIVQGPSEFDEDTFDYQVTVRNDEGEILDSFSDVELISEFAEGINDAQKKPYQLINHLFRTARRKALGADKVLDEILSDLEFPF